MVNPWRMMLNPIVTSESWSLTWKLQQYYGHKTRDYNCDDWWRGSGSCQGAKWRPLGSHKLYPFSEEPSEVTTQTCGCLSETGKSDLHRPLKSQKQPKASTWLFTSTLPLPMITSLRRPLPRCFRSFTVALWWDPIPCPAPAPPWWPADRCEDPSQSASEAPSTWAWSGWSGFLRAKIHETPPIFTIWSWFNYQK